MRIVLTGGTGFLGSRIAQRLRDRGDDVVALVRRASRASILSGIGCEIVEGNLDDRVAVERAVEGAEGVFHIAGRFEVGIPAAECPKMQDTNVGGTRRVVDASIAAGVGRIVYASSIVTYGNTENQIVDETHTRDMSKGFLSCYDESKYKAHMLMESRVAKGAPVILVAPGSLYGPGDHSEVGREILQAFRGELPAIMLADVGLTMVHVDDAAEGFIQAFDNGVIGETYILGGEITRLRDVLQRAADIAGKPLPKRQLSAGVLKIVAPIAPVILPRMGYPPNLRELIKTADGVTYWANDAKARKDLGFTTRFFDEGLREFLS